MTFEQAILAFLAAIAVGSVVLAVAAVRVGSLSERRTDWLPGQPGDVAEWGGERWACYGLDAPSTRWSCFTADLPSEDDEGVPADAVLVLPAKTRA